MKINKAKSAATAAVALAVFAGGCGSGSSSSSSAGTTDPSTRTVDSRSSDGDSAEFLRPKSPYNKYVKFGSEAPLSEREAASKALAQSLKARAQANFATQCRTLSEVLIVEIVGPPNKGKAALAACPGALKAIAEPLSSTKKIRANILSEPIAVLRIKGDKGYALFHGNDKKDYAIPMEKENGAWKVDSLVAIDLG